MSCECGCHSHPKPDTCACHSGPAQQEGCGCHHESTHRAPLIISGLVFLTGLLLTMLIPLPEWVQVVWMVVAVVVPLWGVLRKAANELKQRSLGEHTLLVIAVLSAFLIGEQVEGALVLLLFAFGELLEEKAMSYSRGKIASLAAITPDTAWRLTADGTKKEIPAKDICEGDTLYIPPHTRVPADCRVLSGESQVDSAALTGESQSVYVTAGSTVLSGCVNGSGSLTATALRESGQSAAARILRLVEDSVARKGRSERFITRFARVYTPLVTVAALLVALIPPLLGGGWINWFYRALAFLVASCPCALVISIPLSFYTGIAAAARRGVLIKGGGFVEKLAYVKAVAFDKTGTLTTGEQTLTEVVTVEDIEPHWAVRVAAALEQQSSHPSGRALYRGAAGQTLPNVEKLEELPSLGVRGTVEGRVMACGGSRLLERLGIPSDTLPAAPVYLTLDGVAVAAFSLQSELQEGAAAAVVALRRDGIRRLVVFSGDRQEEVEAIGRAVGITGEVYGELLPEDKLTGVHDLQEDGLVTAFVGDGINDAPVLAAADVGIAMGLGSQAAIETADAVLVSGGLSRLPSAIRLCRRVVRTARINIAFALGVKALVLVLAVCGVAPMWLAVFADMGVTLLTVCHALSLLLPVQRKG